MTDLDHIEQRFRQLLAQASPVDGPLSMTLPLSGISFHSLPEITGQRYFWSRPDREAYWLGLGSAWRVQRQGHGHLPGLADEAEQLAGQWRQLDPEACGQSPRLAVNSASERGSLNLPVLQISSCNGLVSVTVTPNPRQPDSWCEMLRQTLRVLDKPPEPLSGPPLLTVQQQLPQADVWMRLAEQAIRDIGDGRLHKVVLARRVTLMAHRALSVRHLVQTLSCQHPHCTIFAVDTQDGCWVGASPEGLLDLRHGRFACEAVAGTVRRDPYETVDRELGEWLRRDPKNRYEHDLVVEALRAGLAPISSELQIPAEPVLLRLRGLQHLYTPIRGELREPVNPLRIADDLHPSPAICGTPKQPAAAWLRQHEPLQRRLFTGITGWLDAVGNAALNVVLRCAHLQHARVDLYAGAGLVAGSDPLAEWEETELKLDNMKRALQDA